jgi:hypothetical protein
MGYLVRAVHVDGVTGSFRAEKDTRREALRLARTLREEGRLRIFPARQVLPRRRIQAEQNAFGEWDIV